MQVKLLNFKGIKFFNNSFINIFKKINKGGVLVAPAASALSQIYNKKKYFIAIKSADIAILDSGLFCILVRIFLKKKVKKLSGYLFLRKFINLEYVKKKKILLVDPSNIESKINFRFLKNNGFTNITNYVAPKYKGKIKDLKLLKIVKKVKPRYVVINIGGGVQEILGIYIKDNTDKKISVFCTGAAIAFLTGRQAPINDFVDKFYLGWFWRLIYNPKKFFFRIIYSLKLIRLFIKY